MLLRRIGTILRGKATPAQIVMACVLGSMIGFLPSFMTAPGLTIALLLLLIVLNANLIVAAVVGLVATLVSLAALPLSFEIGRVLLHGPTKPLFEWLINAPVFALFGFDYYATTGSLVLGLVFGVIAGALLVWAVVRFRRKMANLEENSERYKRYAGKWWVRALAFVFVGKGHGKKTYAEILQKKVGNPIRPIGVVFALLVVGLLFVAQAFASGPIVTLALQRGLERANGATVDINSADLNLRDGRLVIHGLAMADPNELSTDLLRASRVEANVSGADLLRKRLALDSVVVVDGLTGAERVVPGRVVGRWPERPPAPPVEGEEKTLEDWLRDAETWKERLTQLKRWMERVSRDEDPDALPPGERRETLEERLRRRAQELGYARVRADHLVERAPTLLVRELVAEGVRTEGQLGPLADEVLDVRAENISTQPWLAEGKPSVRVSSRSGNLLANLGVVDAPAEGEAVASGRPIEFVLRGLSGDAVGAQLAQVAGGAPIRGGTIDIEARGVFDRGDIDLPLMVTVRDALIRVAGQETDVDALTLPLGVRGPIDNPVVMLRDEALADALVAAGKARLASEVRDRAGAAIDEARQEVRERVGDRIGQEAGDRIRGLFGGDREREERRNDDD